MSELSDKFWSKVDILTDDECWNGQTMINHEKLQVLARNLKNMEDVMQFTGLLDKEGTDIYEGDILSTDFAGSHVKGVMEYEITVTGAQWTKFLPLNRYEVIGNIHENPELVPQGDR